jgi:hypothetical protein
MLPGTPDWLAKHPAGDWFKNAKYNAAYDPMHFGDSNHGIPYQGANTYVPQLSGEQSTQAPMTYDQQMASGIPGSLANDTWTNGKPDNQVPTWKPPAPMPEQNQGQLFQNNNQGGQSAIPSWTPPASTANQSFGQTNPSSGTFANPIQQRNQPSRYQSPSSRYARNMNQF